MLYETGKKLYENSYHEIGMDHFALETDSLYDAFQNGTLHRNFMGYSF
jgi:oxygen-independent coproporphyrinogen-3 oxidase